MKIIKEGKKLESVMLVTCKNCGAVLEITANDLTEEKNYTSDFDFDFYYTYKCPCCSRIQSIKKLSKDVHFEFYAGKEG